MKALIIDSTRNSLLVCLILDDEVFKASTIPDNKLHTASLLPMIDNLLNMHNLDISDIQYLSAVIGPGSFTGIRIGVATVNAFSKALGTKLIEINALEAVAYNKKGKGLALIDALHGNCYGAEFEGGSLIKTDFYEACQLKSSEIPLYKQLDDYDYAFELCELLKSKVKIGQFADKLQPLYLRKSQAEREAENG